MSKAEELANKLGYTKGLEPLDDGHIKEAAAHIRALDASHQRLLDALEGVLKIGRGTSGRIILEGWHEEPIRSAIKQAKELS